MSVIFKTKTDIITAMRDYCNAGIAAYFDVSAVSDDALVSVYEAAEADASRRLRVYFQNTKVIPNTADANEIAALEAANTPYVMESAYDYDPNFFKGSRWGFIVTREKPINSVESIQFAYPAPTTQVWEVPHDWIRMDQKYGQIRLVPATNSFSAPLTAFVMQALGGGYEVPFMIQVRYFAGLTNVQTEWPDLVDLLKKMAALRLLTGSFLPSSMSTSSDGNSESTSFNTNDWHTQIEAKLEALRDAIHGVRMSALGVF